MSVYTAIHVCMWWIQECVVHTVTHSLSHTHKLIRTHAKNTYNRVYIYTATCMMDTTELLHSLSLSLLHTHTYTDTNTRTPGMCTTESVYALRSMLTCNGFNSTWCTPCHTLSLTHTLIRTHARLKYVQWSLHIHHELCSYMIDSTECGARHDTHTLSHVRDTRTAIQTHARLYTDNEVSVYTAIWVYIW